MNQENEVEAVLRDLLTRSERQCSDLKAQLDAVKFDNSTLQEQRSADTLWIGSAQQSLLDLTRLVERFEAGDRPSHEEIQAVLEAARYVIGRSRWSVPQQPREASRSVLSKGPRTDL
jgi:hypothetical protein